MLPGKQQALLWLLIPLRSASKGLWSQDTYHEGALRDKAIVHGDSYANKPFVFWTGERGQEFTMFPFICRAVSVNCPYEQAASRTSQARFPVKWGLCWPLTQALMFLPTLIELQEQSAWLPAWSELVFTREIEFLYRLSLSLLWCFKKSLLLLSVFFFFWLMCSLVYARLAFSLLCSLKMTLNSWASCLHLPSASGI